MVADMNTGAIQQQERLAALEVDVTDPARFAALLDRTEETFGAIDLMFNVAGGGRPGTILDLSPEDWRFCIDLNMTSVFLGTGLAARSFVRHGKRGAIVNVASINATVPLPGGLGYAAGKAGAAMISRQAALELGEHGIRVNTVSPGLTNTPLTSALLDSPAVRGAFLERIQLGRPAEPEEIARAALFLASEEASYISGTDLVVDGAWLTTGYPDLRNLA